MHNSSIRQVSPIPNETLLNAPSPLFQDIASICLHREILLLFSQALSCCQINDGKNGHFYAQQGLLAIKHKLTSIKLQSEKMEKLYQYILKHFISRLKETPFESLENEIYDACSYFCRQHLDIDFSEDLKEPLFKRIREEIPKALSNPHFKIQRLKPIENSEEKLYVSEACFRILKIISLYKMDLFQKVIDQTGIFLFGIREIKTQIWPVAWGNMIMAHCHLRTHPSDPESAIHIIKGINKKTCEPKISQELKKCYSIAKSQLEKN